VDSIEDIFNEHAIPRLIALNGWPADRCPKLAHGDIQTPNLAALADYISKLQGAGVNLLPDDALENYLRRVAGLPGRRPGDRPVNARGDSSRASAGSESARNRPQSSIDQARAREDSDAEPSVP
jgi:hypothetical protein